MRRSLFVKRRVRLGGGANDWVLFLVMSCARSLIVDTLPIEKQQAGAAWGQYITSLTLSLLLFKLTETSSSSKQAAA